MHADADADAPLPRLARADVRAGLLAVGGLALLVAAPRHRLDLALYGLLAALGGLAWRPRLGPACVGLALPFAFFGRGFGPLNLSPPVLALLLALGGLALSWAWHRLRGRPAPGSTAQSRARLDWPTTGYDGPTTLFLAAAALSLLVTRYPVLSLRDLRALIVEPVLFFWFLRLFPTRSAARWALAGFLASATLLALVAVAQVLLGLGGTQAEGVRRAQAWYPSPNHLGLILGRAFPFLLALVVAHAAGRLAWPAWPAWLARLAALVVGAGILLTFSAGAWLGTLAASLAVLAALGRRREATWLAAAAIGLSVLASALALAGVLPERLSPLRATTGFRVELWLSSLAMLRDYPLLGIGLDNFVYLYQQVYLREGGAAEPNLSHPHNWVLHVWLQLGLLGLVAFVWLVWRFLGHARAALQQQHGLGPTMRHEQPGSASPQGRLAAASVSGTHADSGRVLAAGALGAMADTLVHGLLDNSYFLVDLAFVFWLCLALVVQVDRRQVGRGPRVAETAPFAPGPS